MKAWPQMSAPFSAPARKVTGTRAALGAALAGVLLLLAWTQVRLLAAAPAMWPLTLAAALLVLTALVLVAVWREVLFRSVAAEAERLVQQQTAELARTTERLEGLLRASPLPIVMADASHRVQVWNAAAERVFGWPAAEIVGRPSPLSPGDSDDRPIWRPTAEEGTSSGLDVRLQRKDGSPVDVRLFTARVVDADGGTAGTMAVLKDVTEQRQLEAQFRHAQKMDAIGKLAGGVAHDFNNLLQVITGYTSLALGEVAADHPLRPELVEIQRATGRATALVGQLLAFSRRHKIERRPLDLNEAVGNLLKMLRRVIGEHVELEFVPGEDLRPVSADGGLIEQVLMNLCVNARDAMPDGGRITITTASLTLGRDFVRQRGWGQGGEYVLLSVRDTGPGIPPGMHDRIFEPFFTTKGVGQGTGLGLATVYGIVKQHDGMIEAVRDGEPGAEFRIYLPIVADAKELPAEEAEPLPAVGGHETILLAEDEDVVRSLARRVLEGAGYRVLVAKDGKEAAALIDARASDIDLALLDVVMPKGSGRDVSSRLKAVRPDVPVLFSSGYSRQTLDDSWRPEDGAELILKPYEPKALLRRVRETLERVRQG